jgi:hypothetical protein
MCRYHAALLFFLTSAALAVAFPAAADADTMAHVCNVAPPAGVAIEPVHIVGGCGGFTVRDRRGRVVQRVARAALGSGRLLASADGRTVVFVHDYPMAYVDETTHLIRWRTPLDGVVVFRDSAEVTRIPLDTLVPDARETWSSVSHVTWLGAYDKVVGTTWRLSTLPGLCFAIDTRTGKMTRLR